MARPKFSQDEFKVVGSYEINKMFTIILESVGMTNIPDSEPRFNRPISPKENLKLVLDGKKPYWIPYGGAAFGDLLWIAPRQVPDNLATRLIIDGGPAFEYGPLIQRSSWFDLDWEYMPAAGGATVHPGDPKLTDMFEWEKYISMPNLDDIDWEAMKKENKKYLSTDKFNEFQILSGPWERLISLMDVENAAVTMIDEEQEEDLLRFFDQYCTVLCDLIDRAAKYLNIDGVLMHDDWGHQNGPFFSQKTARTKLLPNLKRIVNTCHKNGLYYEQHTCGKNETFIDMYIEAGVNLYCPQANNDINYLLDRCKDSQLVIGMPDPVIPHGASDNEIRKHAKDWVEKYKDNKIVTSFLAPNPVFLTAIYEYSRIAYQNED